MRYPQSPNHSQFHTGTHEDGAVVGSTSALKAAQAKYLDGTPTASGTRSAECPTVQPCSRPIKGSSARGPLRGYAAPAHRMNAYGALDRT
jgi:hypothetical protein